MHWWGWLLVGAGVITLATFWIGVSRSIKHDRNVCKAMHYHQDQS